MNDLCSVVFSKNRPLQTDLLLSSFKYHCDVSQGAQGAYVIYKADKKYRSAYSVLRKEHNWVDFIEETNFKQDLLDCLDDEKFVLFLCDDSIFIKDFDLKNIIELLQDNKKSIGFSLRLGGNCHYCYSLNKDQSVPYFYKVNERVIKYDWTLGQYDFQYPLEISSSVYRVDDLINIIYNTNFKNPNELEWILYNSLNRFRDTKFELYCYDTSVCFSNPINRVQSVNNNRFGGKNKFNIENLLTKYEKGVRINPKIFEDYVPYAVHHEVDFFIMSE